MKIGDKVAVIDDVITGIVTKIDNNTVSLVDENDFTFRFFKNELVVIEQEQSDLSKYINIAHQDLLAEKRNFSEKKRKKTPVKKGKQPPMEVDLHIHQLIDSTRGMDNYDMLNLQIETAKQKIEFAIAHKISRIVFIHGVGEGVLKNELEFLFKKYNTEYYPASFQKYGFGATEVYIYQNQ
ncbi:MAG: Smr/MutS family protein [Flavobacteriaceae bacterium]|nr:Smr/MutS family protein [Flavobacteriaceae bacterium]